MIKEEGLAKEDYWEEWIYDIFDDMDVETYLYSDYYLAEDEDYHFLHWMEDQFYCE